MKQIFVFAAIALTLLAYCHCNPIKMILETFKAAPAKEQFKVYHHIFNKNYDLNSEEGLLRYKIFKDNLKKIKEVNDKNLSYKFGINQFTDMTKEEFQKNYLMSPKIKRQQAEETIRFLESQGYFDSHADKDEDEDEGQVAPTVYSPIDWRKYYLPARDQNPCGSCWAFTITGLIEGHLAKRLGSPVPYLSPQQLVDCDTKNNGCDGGEFTRAMEYVTAKGVAKDSDYPYSARKESCKPFDSQKVVKIKAWDYCSNYNMLFKKCTQDKVYQFLQQGPVAIGIDGDQIGGYESGILISNECSEDNHAVILVGYGIDPTLNMEYWLIRNSWGRYWGENGYIRTAVQNAKYSCFVTYEAYSVTPA